MFRLVTAVAALAATVSAHGDHEHDQAPIAGPHQGLWYNSLPGDGGKQADAIFSGISTFGRLDYHPCLASDAVKYDIAFIGKHSNPRATIVETNTHQVLLSTPALPTVQVPASVQTVSDKVLAVSTSSM